MKAWMNEQPFQPWYQTATKDDLALLDRVEGFAHLFEDMIFSNGTPTHEFIRCQSKLSGTNEWIDDEVPIPEEIEYFLYTFFTYHVSNLEGFSGCFNGKDYSLSVDVSSVDDDSVVLHEMIHLHEFVINDLPMFYHDAVLYCLYRDLSNKIVDLNERIEAHGHILNSNQIAETGGVHDILFLLKSFDLDLKMGYKLGTVFGYGMTEQPKEKPATNKFAAQVKREKAESRFVRVEVKEPEKVEPTRIRVTVDEPEKVEPTRIRVTVDEPEKVEPMRFILKPQDERKQSQ